MAQRLAAVRRVIAVAAKRSGRLPDAVSLLAVSKTHPVEAVCAAYDAGQMDFGENYADELVRKASAVAATGRQPRWHFVGSLQHNKVATVLPWLAAVHSLDRLRLAKALAARWGASMAGEHRRPLPVYLQVNLADEAHKSGVAAADADALSRAVIALPQLHLQGLMAVPPDPRSADAEHSAHWFIALAQLRDSLAASVGPDMGRGLSMGMSHDFATAIGAGATLVRVGTALFGNRVR